MIIQCDFDGTVTTNNLSLLLRRRFAGSRWRVIEAEYLAGWLTVEESNRRQYALIKEPREVLESFVLQHIKVRSGFVEFVEHCETTGIRLAIVSSGLDFYIETVLNAIGVPVLEVHCGRAAFGADGITVEYTDPEGFPITGSFKQRWFAWLRNQGDRVAYVGDGLSDFHTAVRADHVFATGHLHHLLKAALIPHVRFSTFAEIRDHIAPQ